VINGHIITVPVSCNQRYKTLLKLTVCTMNNLPSVYLVILQLIQAHALFRAPDKPVIYL